jgi:NTP pyrophosphatase (non-canonical NTP hydrolase)
MGQITDLQEEHREWLAHNFPNQQDHDGLLGIIEEVGELAHAHLKHQQGIRSSSDRMVSNIKKVDALGDIFIYMMSYCNTNGLDLEACIKVAWDEVKNRDWQANPITGGTP